MNTIWKYATPKPGHIEIIKLPIVSNIIHFGEDPHSESGLAFWVIVDSDKLTAPWDFIIIGTGQEIPSTRIGWVYVSTTRQGLFVWHLFKKKG